MSLASDRQLRDAIFALHQDVGGLHTVSGVGFADADGAKVTKALQAVAGDDHWKFVDLRASSDVQARAALASAMSAPTLVVATRPDAQPRPLVELVRAFIDKRRDVDLGDHRPLTRTQEESLVLVCDRCDSSEQLSAELLRVPYWDFLG